MRGESMQKRPGGFIFRNETIHAEYHRCRFFLHGKQEYWLFFITLFLIFFLVFPQGTAADNQTITCGVILPLSGEMNLSGNSLLEGIELAADEINTAGGVDGHRIDLMIRDDTGDPDTALLHFKQMQEKGVPVVIGSFSTDLTLPMARESKTGEMILISPTANGEALYGISPRYYQVYGPCSYVGRSISDWLSYTADRVACIYVDDMYGRSLYTAIQSSLNDSITISGVVPVGVDDSDISGLTKKILDSGPDSIVLIIYDSRLVPIIQSLSDRGFRGKIVLADSSVINTLESEAADSLSKFFIFTIFANSNFVPGIQTERFIADYQKKFGEDPRGTLSGYGYDSLMVLADAIRLGSENGPLSPASLEKGLQATRYFGVTGPKVFDSHNSVSPALDRWVFRDGRFRQIITSLP